MNFISKKRASQTDKPKILMVIGGLDAGGKERQLIALLKGLRSSSQFSINLVVMNPNGLWEKAASQFVDEMITIKRISNYDLLIPFVQLTSFIIRKKIRIIHSWGSGIWDLFALFLSKFCNISFLHGGIRSSPATLNLSNKLSKWSARRADVVVANSQAGLKAFGVGRDHNSKVIYNGIEMTRFEGYGEYPSKENNLCMVANFSNKKDHLSVVEALPIIIKTIPEVTLTFVGHEAGTFEDVRKKAEDLGVKRYIQFVTDCLSPEPYIAQSAVGILATNKATHGEGTANALLEYMALSKPVIATDHGGNREVVNHGVNGFLVFPDSPEVIAEFAVKLLKDKRLAEKMGKAGNAMVKQQYNMQKMVTSYIEVYENLILKKQDHT